MPLTRPSNRFASTKPESALSDPCNGAGAPPRATATSHLDSGTRGDVTRTMATQTPRPFQIRSRRRFSPRSATKIARWGRAPLTSAVEKQKDAERQVDATKRSFKREDRRPGSDPYAQVATMRRRGALRRCDRGIARPWLKRGQSDLGIVFAHGRSCDAVGNLRGRCRSRQ